MKLILNNTDDSFDVVALSNLFFPRDGFTEEKGKRLTITRTENAFEALFETEHGTYRAKNEINPALHDGERCAIKRAAYDVFSQATGIESPWGILSGVRPIRFFETVRGIYGDNAEEVMAPREDRPSQSNPAPSAGGKNGKSRRRCGALSFHSLLPQPL